jgi:hypothetical protein
MSNGFPKLKLLSFYCRGCATELTIPRNRDFIGKCPRCNETYRAIYDTIGGWMVQPVKVVAK